jgi:outer membrane protein OmpA-like peptidoglycan-associated protein
MKKILLGTVGALALCTAPADAARYNGWYVSLEGGANFAEDWNARSNLTSLGAVTTTAPAHASYNTGWAVLGSVGYAFRNWRVELEGGYRHNNTDKLVIGPTIGAPTFTTNSGHVSHWSIMANALYDIPLGERWSLTLGAGAGGADTHIDYVPLPGFKDDNWNFAYQGIAGLNYAIGSRTDLFLDYRYFRVVDPSFDFRGAQNVFLDHADDFANHTVTLGLRFALSAPEAPPPPPPAAAPEPPPPPPPPEVKHFVIFFGFNKCNITAEADGVLSQAAQTAKSTGAASISIVGHTDTVGKPRYNQRLSECRANAAKSNLVSKGISGASISAVGKGETELMVQTGDNVKEPQNRRATVDLQ